MVYVDFVKKRLTAMKTRYCMNTLEKNTVKAFLDANITDTDLQSFEVLNIKVCALISALIDSYSNVFNINYYTVYIAYALSYTAKKALDISTLTVCDYIRFVAQHKRINEVDINDFGAFGDLLELLVRLAFIGNISLVRSNSLHVKGQSKTDIVSKKYGKIEVGHNGKSWTKATVFDFMTGDFDSVVYGMFSDIEKSEIYALCEYGNIDKAIEYVKEYTCYWSDKYQYLHDMDNLSRGKGLTIKSGTVQTVYNDSKYIAFEKAIEDGKFTTLADIL